MTCDLSGDLGSLHLQLTDMDFHGSRILVTGGAGFLGTWLCSLLISKGADVLCIDNLSSGLRQNISTLEKNPRFSFLFHDISEPIQFRQKIDYVLHLASRASPLEFDKFPLEIIRANTLGTMHALDIATAHGARFLYTSTSEVYGNADVFPTPESYHGDVNTVGIRGCYDESKRMGEAICLAYLREKGTDIRIARIFNTYGPLMRADGVYGRVIPRLISQALMDIPMTIFGDGSQTRSFCYVTDLIEGIYRLLLSDEVNPVNIGNPEERTVLDFARLILKLMDSNRKIIFKELPQDDPKVRRPDISRARELLGWEPVVDIEEGLRNTIEYFRKSRKVSCES